MAYLESGPADGWTLARDVLGLARAPRALADRVTAVLLEADPRVTRTADGRWALAPEVETPALDACRFAVVDVETTGSSLRHGDRIIEIAVATVAGGEVRLGFQSLVNPEIPIAPFVTCLTGITAELLRRAPRFHAIADDVLASLQGAVFVAHNVRFDWAFLAAELQRARALRLEGPRLCTVRLARRLLPLLERRDLDTVARHLGVAIAGRHRAGGDALAAARILMVLLDRARERGAARLADLGRVKGA